MLKYKKGYKHPVIYNWLILTTCYQFCSMAKTEQKKEIPLYAVEFGKHLRKLRKKKEMSIEEIAYKAGLDAQNLRKYELGKQEMKISMLKRIADAFEISVSELVKF